MRNNEKEAGLSEQGGEQRSLSSSDDDALPLHPQTAAVRFLMGGDDASLITTSVVTITFSLSAGRSFALEMRHERARKTRRSRIL